jgi:hypothetical protein
MLLLESFTEACNTSKRSNEELLSQRFLKDSIFLQETSSQRTCAFCRAEERDRERSVRFCNIISEAREWAIGRLFNRSSQSSDISLQRADTCVRNGALFLRAYPDGVIRDYKSVARGSRAKFGRMRVDVARPTKSERLPKNNAAK